MTKKTGWWQTLLAVVAVGGATALTVYAVTDTNSVCVTNAGRIANGTRIYASDYDDVMPAMTSAAKFTQLVGPYVRDLAPYGVTTLDCPATRSPFVPNTALSEVFLSAIPDEAQAEVLRDGPAHSDGKRTVAFLDGHVERGGVDQTETICILNLRTISNGALMYAQDYDETLPPTATPQAFQTAVLPYVGKSSRCFRCPDTHLAYTPNPVVGGRTIGSFGDWDAAYGVELARDAAPHPDAGSYTVSFIDGHIERGGVDTTPLDTRSFGYLKRLSLAVLSYASDYDEKLPPLNPQTKWENALYPYADSRRVFRNPETGLPYQRNLSLEGLSLSDVSNPADTLLLRDAGPNGLKREHVAFLDGHVREICQWFETNRDGNTDLLWQNDTTRAVALWRMNGAGRIGFETLSKTPGADYMPIATCDADQDGDPDIFWRQRQFPNDTFCTFMDYDTGKAVQKGNAVTVYVSFFHQIAGMPDVDGDAVPDFVFRNTSNGDILVQRRKISGSTFATQTVFPAFDREWKLVTFPDLNGDNNPDWVLQNTRTGAVAYWLMKGTARIGSGYIIKSLATEWQVQGRYDINHDNKPDLLLRNTQTGALVCWRMNGVIRTGTQTVTTGVPLAWKLVGMP